MADYSIGIDIGSTSAKTIVLGADNTVLLRLLQPTGWSSVDTAQAIHRSLTENGFSPERAAVVATGYGRVAVPYADKCVTEITCHSRGGCSIYGCSDMTLIDIGGQDTKVIAVQDGGVADFLMNDKCSAGTGRFLEVMANLLAVSPYALCQLAADGRDTTISSMCTVFAESEVISLIGSGERRENIAFAVVDSIVQKVASQVARLEPLAETVCLTGGLCDFDYLRQALSKQLGRQVRTSPDGRYAGAIGAALLASKIRKDV